MLFFSPAGALFVVAIFSSSDGKLPLRATRKKIPQPPQSAFCLYFSSVDGGPWRLEC
jgi:hypothetical protein